MTYLQANCKHIEVKDHSVGGEIKSIGKQILTLLMLCDSRRFNDFSETLFLQPKNREDTPSSEGCGN